MNVLANGSIDIDDIKDKHGRLVEGEALQDFITSLQNGDYVIDLKNKTIFNLLGGGFEEVGTFAWSVEDMEYDFHEIEHEEIED